ncbi:aspartate/glutamate racemase family protein [Amycolatopsis sp. 3B14]|uniref:aspartate/glutamate racemase family protein n=1 Tax=Amycolatopsis sp. 3B14 TaxID=3243600 RepID=UPI003D9811C1
MERSSEPTVVKRGQAFYGVDVGVILMDSDAPRAVGDVGNARTFPFPVAYTTADGAYAEQVVEHDADGLLDQFLSSGKELVSRGVRAIGTSCGFVAIHQQEIAAGVNGLVATSSLLQIPLVLQLLGPDGRVGVVTANAATLSPRHFAAVGVDEAARRRLTLIGLEHTEHFYQVMVAGRGALDTERAEAEVLAAVHDALATTSGIKALVLECTNLPPYADAIRRTTGLPVWDVTTMLSWIQSAVRP